MTSSSTPLQEAIELLRTRSERLGIHLSPKQLSGFEIYARLLIEWSRRFNLTAIRDPMGVVVVHFLDSLSCLSVGVIPPRANVIDVGSGAGFPGIPLKIARQDLKMTLLEASRRRVAFLEMIASELKQDVEVVHGRAEDEAHNPDRREKYDVALSRAVAGVHEIVGMCLPFVRPGGWALLSQGPSIRERLPAVRQASARLGGGKPSLHEVSIAGMDRARYLLVVPKVRPRPEALPLPKRSSRG